MKLRNKLVAVLAASMVVTSVPVVTMADTTNYVSTGRYAQKGTTYGYLEQKTGGYTVIYGQSVNGIGGSSVTGGYDYLYSNGFEFVPQFDYNQTSSMFLSLSQDTNFNAQAIVTYIDAFNSSTGHTNLVFDADGYARLANNPAWNGKKADDLLKAGIKMYVKAGAANTSAVSVFNGLSTTLPSTQIATIVDTEFEKSLVKYNSTLFSDAQSVWANARTQIVNAIVDEIKENLEKEVVNGTATGNVIVKPGAVGVNYDELASIVNKAVNEIKHVNEISTLEQVKVEVTRSQLTKAPETAQSSNTIIESVFKQAVEETVENVKNELNKQAYGKAYDDVAATAPTVITVEKVESFDVKDANDREYKSHLRVTFNGTFTKGCTYKVPVLAKFGGDKNVILNVDGRDTFVTSGKYNLTNDALTDKRLTVTADNGAKLRTNYADAIGELRFTESQIKSLVKNGENRKIKISLPSSSDLEFNLSKTLTNAKAVGKRGFYNQSTVPATGDDTTPNIEFYANSSSNTSNLLAQLATNTKVDKSNNANDRLRISYGVSSRRNSYTDLDKQTLIIELPDFQDDYAVGEIALSGIYVQPKDNTAAKGDINVTVEEYLADRYYTNNYGNSLQLIEAKYDVNGNYIYDRFETYFDKEGNVYPFASTDVINKDNVRLFIRRNLADGSPSSSSIVVESTNLIESTTLKVGEIREYDVSLTCDKPVEIKAGRSGLVNDKKTTFVLEENVKDSLVDGRKIEFKLENGYMFGPADVDTAAVNNNSNTTGHYASNTYKQLAMKKFEELVASKTIKFEEKADKDTANKKEGFVMSTLDLVIDSDGRVVGFSGEYDRLKDTEADKIKVTIPVATDVMSTGDVKVTASNIYTRSFQDKKEDPSAIIANIKAPIEVTFDGAKLKVGQQAQEAGTITIKETDKGMLEKGWLFLAAKDQNGITFDAAPTVKVADAEGKQLTVKAVELSKDKTILGIELTKSSTEASTITIDGINLTADRTVPQANYDLAIWGSALTDENELGIGSFTQNALYSHSYFTQSEDLYIVKDFIQMTTANTEDLIGAAKAVTTEFVIGQKKFTVNGESVTMDSAPYIKDNLTFVPVRYLAQAFGIQGNAVQYDKATGTVTIVAGDKVIKMTKGKAIMTVNGTDIPMASKAEIGKEGRMCVPMAYIASALGVEKSWNSSTKTATFTNVK